MSAVPGDSSLAGTSPHAGKAASAPQAARAVPHRRRPFGAAVLHAPQTLRALVRADEIWLVALAAIVGIVAGLVVVAMNTVTQFAHHVLFRLQPSEMLSAATDLRPGPTLLVPALG